jgi:hypothetical protein
MNERTTLEQRLDILERAHRRLTRLTGLLLLAGVAVALLGAGKVPPDTAVARSIHVVDDKGKVRILINPRAGVSLLDKEGRPRAVLSVDDTGPGLAMYGTSSKTGTILNVNDDGPALAMRDNDGKTRALLAAISPGPALILSDANERERIALMQRGDRTDATLIDQGGRIVWHAP